MNPDALIGTGFVGGNLLRQMEFGSVVNSRSVDSIRNSHFRTVICAGARAEKWIANQQPEEDRQGIERLVDVLSTISADRFILISTVDVFANPAGVDESFDPSDDGLHPYGLNRLNLERFVRGRFSECAIVRLPGLFGKGLKKNIIYDFLHQNEVAKVDSRAEYQFYRLDRLSSDIARVMSLGLNTVHLVTEPVSVAEVARTAFGLTFVNQVAAVPARYDLHTRYAHEFGGAGSYIESSDAVLESIRQFVQSQRPEATA